MQFISLSVLSTFITVIFFQQIAGIPVDSSEEILDNGREPRNLLGQYLAALAMEKMENEMPAQIKTEQETTTQATTTERITAPPSTTTQIVTNPPIVQETQTQSVTVPSVTAAGGTTRRSTVDPVHVNNQVHKILENVNRLNVTGIVDQSLQINTRPHIRDLVNGILKIVIPWPLG